MSSNLNQYCAPMLRVRYLFCWERHVDELLLRLHWLQRQGRAIRLHCILLRLIYRLNRSWQLAAEMFLTRTVRTSFSTKLSPCGNHYTVFSFLESMLGVFSWMTVTMKVSCTQWAFLEHSGLQSDPLLGTFPQWLQKVTSNCRWWNFLPWCLLIRRFFPWKRSHSTKISTPAKKSRSNYHIQWSGRPKVSIWAALLNRLLETVSCELWASSSEIPSLLTLLANVTVCPYSASMRTYPRCKETTETEKPGCDSKTHQDCWCCQRS